MSINKTALRRNRCAYFGLVIEGEYRVVVPVLDNDGADIHVVVRRRRPIDNQRSKDSLAVLETKVRVIPGSTVYKMDMSVGPLDLVISELRAYIVWLQTHKS